MTATRQDVSAPLARLRVPALAAGAVGALACIVGAFVDREHFFVAYLWAYFFWLGIALGSMAVVMLHTLTGGQWGTPLRRIAEAAMSTLPLMAVLFVPLLLGLHELYPWAQPAAVAAEEVLRHRAPLFERSFFLLRATAYFAVWIVLALSLRRWSARADVEPAEPLFSRMRTASAAGLILYVLTITHAGVDWIFSRDVHFYSTASGFVLSTGQTLSAFAFLLIMVTGLAAQPALRGRLSPPVLIDLGNLLMTMVVLWAYVSFFQFLVIWMGNTREDNSWYTQRGVGQLDSAWKWVGVLLMIIHFAVPFAVLLFRAAKRRLASLAAVAGVVLLAHVVEQAWLVLPAGEYADPHVTVSWLDVAAPVGIGGIWCAAFLWLLGRQPLVMQASSEAHGAEVAA
jgi:hypothetical protein